MLTVIVGSIVTLFFLSVHVLLDMYAAFILLNLWGWWGIAELINITPLFWQMFGIIAISDVLHYTTPKPQDKEGLAAYTELVRRVLSRFVTFTLVFAINYILRFWILGGRSLF